MNFQEFRATVKRVESLAAYAAEHMGFETDDTRAALVYSGVAFICVNADGTYDLLLHNAQWVTANLAELEARLFVWCQTECPDDMGLSDDAHRALCQRLDGGDGEAIIAELIAEPQTLEQEYAHWCDVQGLHKMSADELLFEDVTDTQAAWIEAFMARWEARDAV